MFSLFSSRTTKNFDTDISVPVDTSNTTDTRKSISNHSSSGRRRTSARRPRQQTARTTTRATTTQATTSKASIGATETSDETGERKTAKEGLATPSHGRDDDDEEASSLEAQKRKLAAKRRNLEEGERLLRKVGQKEAEVRRREVKVEKIRIHMERETHYLDEAYDELVALKHSQEYKTQVRDLFISNQQKDPS